MYYICTVSYKFPENYQIGVRARKWGVEDKYRNIITKVRRGDLLLFVLGGAFVSVHTIESSPYKDESILWPPKKGDLFPWRIDISDPLLKGSVPIGNNLEHKISFMKDTVRWQGTLQGRNGVFNDRLTIEDFQLIESRMRQTSSQKVPATLSGHQKFKGLTPPEKVSEPVARTIGIPSERQKVLFKFYERDIEDRILSILEEMGLRLYKDPSTGKSGRQFVTDGGRIDLLCTRKDTGDFLVIELKKGEAPQETLLQILRYISWVKQNLTIKNNRQVRGIILTEQADTALQDYIEEVPNVEIRYYKVSITLL